jgi:hypothetical protein
MEAFWPGRGKPLHVGPRLQVVIQGVKERSLDAHAQ